MKAFYEQRVSELTSELARYQQTTVESGAADLVTSSQQNQPTLTLDMMKWVLEKKQSQREFYYKN